MSSFSHNEYCRMFDEDSCSANCEYDLWAPSARNDVNNLAFTAYAGSLYNIGKDLALDKDSSIEEICNRWGCPKDTLTDLEIDYINQVQEEFLY